MAKYMQFCGQKYIGGNDAPYGFARTPEGRYVTDAIDGVVYELEKRSRNPEDGYQDTGWYLYGGGHFGTWCSSRILDAVDVANAIILGQATDTSIL